MGGIAREGCASLFLSREAMSLFPGAENGRRESLAARVTQLS